MLLRRTVAVVAVGLITLVAFPGAAGAHVTVDGQGTQGGFGRVAFRVPNESDTATTQKVEVFVPEAHAMTFAATLPVPGWTATVQRKTLDQPVVTDHGEVAQIVTSITWVAAPAAGVKDGQFQEFPVLLGPMPKADRLVFKALQTYSDGTVVRWIDEPGADGKEPEYPAPVLPLAPAAELSTVEPDRDGSTAPLWLGIAGFAAGLAGLAIGLTGLVLGGLAFRRSRAARSFPGSPG